MVCPAATGLSYFVCLGVIQARTVITDQGWDYDATNRGKHYPEHIDEFSATSAVAAALPPPDPITQI